MNMKEEIITLKKQLHAATMRYGKLKKKSNGANPQAVRLEKELDASRRECGSLVKAAAETDITIHELESQCYHFQQLIAHTAHVTVWKVLE
jgi:predicted  nucleic acid-binding Zn-ribbon protein